MTRMLSCFLVLALLGCNSASKEKVNPKVASFQVEIFLSFGENATFCLAKDEQSAVIQENMRLADSVGVLHQFKGWERMDFDSLFLSVEKLKIDTKDFSGTCEVMDGWKLKGEIIFKTGEPFKFEYQDCSKDTIAHKLTGMLLETLIQTFKQDTVTSDYLFGVYHEYYKGTSLPLDSIQLFNRPLTKLQLEAWNKYKQ